MQSLSGLDRFRCKFVALLPAFVVLLLTVPNNVMGQTYRNVVNTKFNTIANGPLHAIVVDIPANSSSVSIDREISRQIQGVKSARSASLQTEISRLTKVMGWKTKPMLGVPDILYVRQNGKLVVPRGASNRGFDLTFSIPISTAANDGGWTQTQHDEIQAVINTIYPALKVVYGQPSWSGTVVIKNDDNTLNPLSDPNAYSGGTYDVSNGIIHFAVYNSPQSRVLNLTQMMAIAFHGPKVIAYDAWERGMARAATLETVRAALPALTTQFGANAINVADPLWSSLDRYDLMNQPALGNDRFFPVAKVNGQANTSTFPNMLTPRLSMASSAWLKVIAESPNFFASFNQAYYSGVASNPNLPNSVPDLKTVAQGALGGGTVETRGFSDWYDRQFALDTSVSPGFKLYASSSPIRPSTGKDDFGFAVIVYYYQTGLDSNGNSTETNLNGTAYPVYWDYTFTNRLFLAAQYERIDIRDGIGTVAPTFFGNIGGDVSLNGKMRIAIDIPVNNESVRLYVAPRNMGLDVSPSTFWGTVVGMDTGKVRIQTDNGADQTVNIAQGAFSTVITPNPFIRPARATLTVTDSNNNQVIQTQVNTGYTEYSAVIYASDPISTLTHTFPAGPAMISFPISPLKPNAVSAMLDPVTNVPVFNLNNLLMAEWRQTINDPNGDNYMRFPSMDPLRPGHGYMENFSADTPVSVTGRVSTNDQAVSIPLLHGWNQIGSPYNQPVNVSDLQFQYLADNTTVDLNTAISKSYIVAQNVTGAGLVTVWDFTPASGYVPATVLQPWHGYWIRVLVSEGITMTFPNPTAGGKSVLLRKSASTTSTSAGWAVKMTVSSNDGLGSSAYFGIAETAAQGYDKAHDALRPPSISRSVPSVSFDHSDWGTNSGSYFSEIRRSVTSQPWEITVATPDPTKTYTVTWSNLNTVPRTTRLVLLDTATGKRQYMQSSSGVTINPGNSSSRVFKVFAENRGGAALRIANVTYRQSRATGAVNLGFDISQGATVSTDIRGLDGKVIRRLINGRAVSTGTNNMIWDGRNDQSISVPGGTYNVVITAVTPDGEIAKAIQTVIIVR